MRWRDILNPWGALREARAEIARLEACCDGVDELALRAEHELEKYRAYDPFGEGAIARYRTALAKRGQTAPKRDAKTGRFV